MRSVAKRNRSPSFRGTTPRWNVRDHQSVAELLRCWTRDILCPRSDIRTSLSVGTLGVVALPYQWDRSAALQKPETVVSIRLGGTETPRTPSAPNKTLHDIFGVGCCCGPKSCILIGPCRGVSSARARAHVPGPMAARGPTGPGRVVSLLSVGTLGQRGLFGVTLRFSAAGLIVSIHRSITCC